MAVLCAGLLVGASQPAASATEVQEQTAGIGNAPQSSVAKDRRKLPASSKQSAPKRQLTEQFSPTSRTRELANGTTRLEQYSEVRFKRAPDGWRELKGTISAGRGAVLAEANEMAHPIWFGKDPRTNLLQVRLPNGAPTISLPSARNVKATRTSVKGQDVITYPGVAQDTNLVYTVTGARISKAIVLKSAAAPTSFRFHISDPTGLLGTPKPTSGGGFLFSRDLGDELHLELGRPAAWEQGKAATDAQTATQTIKRVKGGYDVDLSLDREWAKDKAFPIILDPTIEYSWPESTLATAYAPVYDEGCPSSGCELAATVDGSIVVGHEVGYLHADLSNFPTALPISSAKISLLDVDNSAFDGTEPKLIPFPVATADPVTAWDVVDVMAADPRWIVGNSVDWTANGVVDEFDVRDTITNWVRKGNGAKVRFGVARWCVGCNELARGGSASTSSLDPPDYGRLRDIKLTIDYQGRPLPPPIPVDQTFGCDCRWVHGASVVGQRLDPVNTAAGAQVESTTDIPAAPAPGVPMDLTRTFNGLDTRAGPLGAGWTHAFDAGLELDPVNGNAVFRDPTGGRSTYVKQLDGSYLAPAGATAVLAGNSTTGWTLSALTGETLTFATDGRPLTDKDRSGKGVTYSYDTNLRLSDVTDSLGRELEFTYGTAGAAAGRLIEVATDDGRGVEYSYTSIASAPRLTQIIDLTGTATTVSYNSNGELTGITDGNGEIAARNTYDSSGRIDGQTDAAGQTWELAWDSVNNIQTITDPRAGVSKDVYHGNVITKHVAPDGGETSFYYDDNLNLVSVVDARDNATTMTYDDAGNMTSRIAPSPFNTREFWEYGSNNQLLKYTDAEGAETAYTYTAQGRVATSETSSGTVEYDYNSAGLLTAITDEADKTTTFGYNASGDQTTITDPLGNITSRAYDPAHRLTSQTDPRGNVTGCSCAADYTTTWTYDDAGRVLTQTDPLDRTTTFTYDDAGNQETVTDAAGATTTYTYTANNQVATITDALNRTSTNAYDSVGNLISVTDPLGRKTTHTYDSVGRLKTTRRPAGNATGASTAVQSANTTTYGYDLAGNQTSVSTPDPNGGLIVTSTAYDELNRVMTTTDAIGGETQYAYDKANRITATQNPAGDLSEQWYDLRGRLAGEVSADGVPTTYDRDPRGNVTTKTVGYWFAESQSVTTYGFDDAGRLTSAVDPRGNVEGCDCAADFTATYTYDPAGNQTSVTDQLGHSSTTTYDAANQILETTNANLKSTTRAYDDAGRLTTITTPGASTTTYEYDDAGNVITRTDPRNNDTTYVYDAANQLVSTTSPGGKQTTHTYDLNGNRTATITPAGNATPAAGDGTVTQTFDALSRVTATSFSDGTPTVSFAYDKASRLVTLGDGLSATRGDQTRTYDAAGRVTAVSRGTQEFTYTFEAARLAGMEYPDGRAMAYTYDDLGRPLTQAWGDHNLNYTYDPANQLTSLERDGAVTTTWQYDRAGRRTGATTSDATGAIVAFTQELDPVGNPVHTTEERAATTAATYAYDNDDQITSVCYGDPCTGSTSKITYAYDPNGNRTQTVRTSVSSPGTTNTTYDTDDQPISTTDATAAPIDTFNHDTNGNLTTVTGTHPASYATNLAGQLTSATVGSVSTTYSYDGVGNRASATNSSGTTNYVWDNAPNPRLLNIDNPGTSPDHAFDYGLAGPVMLSGGTDSAWYVNDLQQNVADLLEPDGTPLGAYTFDPFGVSLSTVGSGDLVTDNPLRFAGEALDPASGLYNNRARQYLAGTGRFLSTDPAPPGPGSSYNSAYPYVGNRPTVSTDPSGMCEWCWFSPALGVATNWNDIEQFGTGLGQEFAADPYNAMDNARAGAARSVTDSAVFLGTGGSPVGRYAYDCYDEQVDTWERQAGLDPDSRWHTTGGVGADVALLAVGVGGAKLGLRGTQLAAELRDISSASRAANAGGSAAVGASRVERVVAQFGNDVVETGRAVKTPFGSTDIDVVLRDGTFIEVGGPAKAANLAKFGQQLQRVKSAADDAGGSALFMYEEGTPQSAIDLATKWFGPGGARPIG